jgi:hypothetical protein
MEKYSPVSVWELVRRRGPGREVRGGRARLKGRHSILFGFHPECDKRQ